MREYDIDEQDLIAFFDELPVPEDDEEREFFAAPCFVKRAAGIRLEMSLSFAMHDLRLEVHRDDEPGRLLRYGMRDVVSVSIDRRQDGRSWICVQSETDGRIEISVNPSIEIVIHACADGAG